MVPLVLGHYRVGITELDLELDGRMAMARHLPRVKQFTELIVEMGTNNLQSR